MQLPQHRNVHRPNHDPVYFPGEYFLTGRMATDQQLIRDDEGKELIFDVLVNLCSEFDLDLVAWVVCDNHYHTLIYSDNKFDLGRFSNRFHSVTATLLNRRDSAVGRKVWYQYWDHRIRDEVDSWKHFNYNHWNPIKHGYINDMVELVRYQYSSFPLWHDLLGQETLEIFFESYLIEDFNPFETK